jgi:hypothetical protein
MSFFSIASNMTFFSSVTNKKDQISISIQQQQQQQQQQLE